MIHFSAKRRQYELDEISVNSCPRSDFPLIFSVCSLDFPNVKEKMRSLGKGCGA